MLFQKFYSRYNINYSKGYGDSSLVELCKYNEQIKKIKMIMSIYQFSNIFNNDETVLFWKQIPNGLYVSNILKNLKKDGNSYSKFIYKCYRN